MKKLNLGCGKRILKGYINIDFPNNAYDSQPDMALDIRKLPFEDNSVDEILAVHVWEHFYLNEVDGIIEEWKRVLKEDGTLILEMPCLDKIIGFIQEGNFHPQLVMWPLYGDPSTHKGEADLHKWCWNIKGLQSFLEKHKFKNIQFTEPEYHLKQRDMRVKAVKHTLDYEYSIDLFLKDLAKGNVDIDDLIRRVATHCKGGIIKDSDDDFIVGSIVAEYFKGSKTDTTDIDLESQPELVQEIRKRLHDYRKSLKEEADV